MHIMGSRLKRIIREETSRVLRESEGEVDIDALADIYRSFIGPRKISALRAKHVLDFAQKAFRRDDEREAVGVMAEIITRAAKLPEAPEFFVRRYFAFLKHELTKAGRRDIADMLIDDAVMPGSLDSIDRIITYTLRYSSQSFNSMRVIPDHYPLEQFMIGYKHLKSNPEAIEIYLALRDSIPKFVRFFGDRQHEEYEERIVQMLDPQDYRSILQASELVEMISI